MGDGGDTREKLYVVKRGVPCQRCSSAEDEDSGRKQYGRKERSTEASWTFRGGEMALGPMGGWKLGGGGVFRNCRGPENRKKKRGFVVGVFAVGCKGEKRRNCIGLFTVKGLGKHSGAKGGGKKRLEGEKGDLQKKKHWFRWENGRRPGVSLGSGGDMD